MGRPYDAELDELPSTYDWATKADVSFLAMAIKGALGLPMTAVGSGGSFTTADFAAGLHRQMASHSGLAQTPLDAVASGANSRQAAVMITTAGGRNPDVIGSFRVLAAREPRKLIVLCMREGTPLAAAARKLPFVDLAEFSPPVSRDGFLATNSLIASAVLLLRAYGVASGDDILLPRTWNDLLQGTSKKDIEKRIAGAWSRDTMVVLHGPETRSAAVDMESKLTEAALRNVWIADLRQFAHGRHHWLAKRAASSSVLVLASPNDAELATRTVALIPKGIPIVREEIPFSGPVAALAALGRVMYIVGSAGLATRVDPGRPGVPSFGRRIYHLNAFPPRRRLRTSEEVAIERQSGARIQQLALAGTLRAWKEAHRAFLSKLRSGVFRGVVLDYDGTLCPEVGRFGPVSDAIAHELRRLLSSGLTIGIATGRGKSARLRLQEAIPEQYWSRVVVGYYNGGEVALLDDSSRPDGADAPHGVLGPLFATLRGHALLKGLATFECRAVQIKVEVDRPRDIDLVWGLVQQLTLLGGPPGALLLRSSHSMDIIAPGVDKRAVVHRVIEMSGHSRGDVLCIGDRGRYPGNDYLLLSTPHALSVDEPSPTGSTGWNLAPLGHRGADACLAYLRRLTTSKRGARFDRVVRK